MGIRFQIKLTNSSVTKGWSDQEVIPKLTRISTHKLQGQIFTERDNVYLVDQKYNITYQNIQGKTKVRPIFMPWNA